MNGLLLLAMWVTLTWDPSPPEEHVTDYILKWGFAPGLHDHSIPNGSSTLCMVDEPWPLGSTVFFVVTATNQFGESLPSNELAWVVPIPTPTPVPAPTPSPDPIHGPITASYLGQTGQNLVGERRVGPYGAIDRQIRVIGVSGDIKKVRVTGSKGVWETPLNIYNWIIAIVPTADQSVVDLFFEPWSDSTSYLVTITYPDNAVVSAQTTTP
jgi:hypothetical protein